MSYCTEDARQQFDSWSGRYEWDPLQSLLFKPSHRMILDLLGPDDRRILDIGCGTGLFASRLLKRFPQSQVYGLDLSDRMLRQGQTRCEAAEGRIQLVQGDSKRLPFAADSFDVVTCTHSFHHYPRQAQVVSETHRVLRPGGKLVIIDGDRDRPWGRLLFDVIVVFAEGRVKHLTSRALRRLYDEVGFEAIDQQRRRGAIPFLMTVGRAVKPAFTPAPRRAG